jgi:general L-amino acid transport system substrate-binding protein
MPVVHRYPIHRQAARAFCMAAFAVCVLPGLVSAGSTLERVRSAGAVRCGISEGLAGFAAKNADGRWSGMDVDFCRAVAAAVLGDPEKVAFVPLTASARFPVLKSRQIDLLVRRTTWTFGREASLHVHFAGTLYYDGQRFMVPHNSPVQALKDLNGATICAVKGTTHEQHLMDTFQAQGLTCRVLVGETRSSAWQAYQHGECAAFTGDTSALAAMRTLSPGGSAADRILPSAISKEPLGPVVNTGDEEWFAIVKWVLFALIEAEEKGVTRANVRQLRDSTPDPAMAEFLGRTPGPGKALGLAPDWVTRVVESVGNYGELYERHLGGQSPFKLDRGLNRLWKDGGLMYSPPFR